MAKYYRACAEEVHIICSRKLFRFASEIKKSLLNDAKKYINNMADYNIFVYIFPSNKKWREKCGTFFYIYFARNHFSCEIFLSKIEPWNQRLSHLSYN